MASERDKELSLVQHLAEFRDRLMVSAVVVAITTAISFTFATTLIRILLLPVDCTFFPTLTCSDVPTRLVALNPTENFTTYMRVSLFAGIAIAMPALLYEVYAYIDPALMPKERRFIRFMALPVIMLFVGGMLFCYFVLLPSAMKFLLNFGGDVIDNQLRASDYLSFVTTFVLGMGIVFEMPVIIYALVRVGVVQRSWLTKRRRYIFLLSFVFAALITPTPDPFNQALVAVPMYLLFEVGLLLARIGGGRRAAA